MLLNLVGCQQNTSLMGSNKTKADMEGFVEPESSDWVKFIAIAREYMFYRTQAVINDDINILWDKYPQLMKNINLNQGVNIENDEVESLNESFDMIDANYNIESNDRIKVKIVNDNEVIILIHGSIVYLRNDFEESGAEHLIKVYLEHKDNHWTVVQTDEYTLPEYKEWLN